MSVEATEPKKSTKLIWTGRVLSAVPVLLLLMSATFKIIQPGDFIEGFEKSGFAKHLALGIGITELVCTILYVIPQTSVLGAILLTGYLGGATVTHVRQEDGMFFAPVLVGVVVWLGLALREGRLWSLIPLRR